MPSDNFELWQVESLLEECYDAYTLFAQRFFSKNEEALRKAFTEDLPNLLTAIQNRLEQNNGGEGYFLGNRATVADVVVAQLVHDLYLNPIHAPYTGNILEERFPKLKGHLERVLADSEPLRNYLATRPSSDN